jgi:hypothetical protein
MAVFIGFDGFNQLCQPFYTFYGHKNTYFTATNLRKLIKIRKTQRKFALQNRACK